MIRDLSAIILAAGKGKRMKSKIPKILHEVCGKPMLSYILDLIGSLKIRDAVVVLGYKDSLIKSFLGSNIKTIRQEKLLGTADAVRSTRKSVHRNNILIIYADNPLIKRQTLDRLIKRHISSGASCTLLTAILDDPTGYGRIIRNEKNNISRIGEEKDISKTQKSIREINSGVYCFNNRALFRTLNKVKQNNKKREFYLTDVIKLLTNSNRKIETVQVKDKREVLGINSRKDLARANQIMRTRILDEFMSKGVTIIDPETTYINRDVRIGQDTIIYPYTMIENNVKIGKDCSIGPFCHIRENTEIKDYVKIGNFVEIVRSRIDKNTLAKHFSYIGDTKIGKRVNIGAGTVTANFNGRRKNRTIIKDGAFIGSGTVLIAPVKIGRKATTGAGSVVVKNRNVADHTIVVGVPARKILKRKR